jgi:hypothetical protein
LLYKQVLIALRYVSLLLVKYEVVMKFMILTLLFSLPVSAKIKVAVIDTGIRSGYNIPICEDGLVNATKLPMRDSDGHGTNVAYLINEEAKGVDYCQVIIKFYDKGVKSGIRGLIRALHYVSTRDDIQIVNISAGGQNPHKFEKMLINKLLKQGKIVVSAAGNNNSNLNKKCNYFPACYFSDIIVVGNGNRFFKYNKSNYGKVVDVWVDGENEGPSDLKMSGTSQATAIHTGKIIRGLANK